MRRTAPVTEVPSGVVPAALPGDDWHAVCNGASNADTDHPRGARRRVLRSQVLPRGQELFRHAVGEKKCCGTARNRVAKKSAATARRAIRCRPLGQGNTPAKPRGPGSFVILGSSRPRLDAADEPYFVRDTRSLARTGERFCDRDICAEGVEFAVGVCSHLCLRRPGETAQRVCVCGRRHA